MPSGVDQGDARVATPAGDASVRDAVVSVQDVSKKFCADFRRSLRYAVYDGLRDLLTLGHQGDRLRRDEFWALRNVSFEIRRGESVGVMGVNGAGKSTLLKLVLGTLRLSRGRITSRGRIAALTEQGIGFDPLLTGRENAYLGAAVLGIDRRRVDEAFDEIVAFANLDGFVDTPVSFYSSGMRARLGFAIAMYLEPEVLLVDEVLAVGDVGFQRRCIEHTRRYLDAGGTLLLVSHNPMLVQTMCERCLVLDEGEIAYDGTVVDGVSRYCELAQALGDGEDTVAPALLDPGGISMQEEGFPAQAAPGGAAESASSDVVIEEFGIRPVESENLRTGEPATIYLRYRSNRDLLARWGFCLLTADSATTIACDGRMTAIRIPAGSGELRGTLAQLPLSGGSYALRVAIMDPSTDLPFAMRGYADPPKRFKVDMPSNRRNNYRMFARDLIVLDGLTWEEHMSDTGSGDPSSQPKTIGLQYSDKTT